MAGELGANLTKLTAAGPQSGATKRPIHLEPGAGLVIIPPRGRPLGWPWQFRRQARGQINHPAGAPTCARSRVSTRLEWGQAAEIERVPTTIHFTCAKLIKLQSPDQSRCSSPYPSGIFRLASSSHRWARSHRRQIGSPSAKLTNPRPSPDQPSAAPLHPDADAGELCPGRRLAPFDLPGPVHAGARLALV